MKHLAAYLIAAAFVLFSAIVIWANRASLHGEPLWFAFGALLFAAGLAAAADLKAAIGTLADGWRAFRNPQGGAS